MAATIAIPEIGGGVPRAPRAADAAAGRLRTLQQLARALRAAVAHWAEDGPEEIAGRQRELETLRDDLAAAPEILAEREEQAAELLETLAATAREVRQINAVYMILLREAQRTIGVRLRHLSAYAPVYAPGASPEPLFWDARGREMRA